MGSGRRIWLRVLVVFVLLCAALAIVGYLYLQRFLDEANPRLESALSEAFGVPVSIGTTSFTIRHGLGIAVHDVQIDRQGDCVAPLLIRDIALRADIRELLQKRIVINHLTVDGLKVQLDLGSDGQIRFNSESNRSCAETSAAALAPTPLPVAVTSGSAEPSLPIILQCHEIGITDLDAELRLPKGRLTIENLRGSGELQLGAEKIRVANIKLKGALERKELALDVKELLLGRSDSSIQLKDSALKLGASELRGSLSLQPGAVFPLQGIAELRDFKADLHEIAPIAASFGASAFSRTLRGRVGGALNFTLGDKSSISGQLTLSQFGIGKDFSISEAELSSIQVDGAGFAVTKVSTRASFKALTAKDGADDFAVKTVEGDISYVGGAALKINSRKISVSQFSYRDQETELADVDADLEQLSLTRSERGDFAVAVRLKGSRLKLRHLDRSLNPAQPDFEIKEISRVDIPIQIKVPRKGGYEIRGPVEVGGGVLVWQKREFHDVGGTVGTLISSPLKKFIAQPITFKLGKEAGTLRGPFEMTAQQFSLPNAALEFAGGKATASFSLARQGTRIVQAKFDCSNIDAGRTSSSVTGQHDSSIIGTLQRGRIEASADWKDLKGTVTGVGSAQFREGIYKSFDFTRRLGRALNAIPGVSTVSGSSSQPNADVRPAQTLIAEFSIKSGTVLFTRFDVQRQDYSLRGTGTLNFDGVVNSSARVTFLKENLGMFGSGLQAVTGLFGGLGRLDVPILISGKIPDISVNVDMTTFLKEKSGISTAESVLDRTGNIIGGVGRTLLSPFSGSEKSKTPTPAPK